MFLPKILSLLYEGNLYDLAGLEFEKIFIQITPNQNVQFRSKNISALCLELH